MNSFWRVVSSGVHQALELGEGRERGAVAWMAVVGAERAKENHVSSCLAEGLSGAGGISQFWSLSVRPGQLASSERSQGLSV